ncbi:MAG: UDP-N-acetylglucosamine 1-carboxyvinyltransferase, partial [Patiriisocius sp.]
MGTFQIQGGHKLKGEITPQGAKNEVLQILCAVLLTPHEVLIENIPDIVDVNKLIGILGNLGVKIQKLSKGTYTFKADDINLDYL